MNLTCHSVNGESLEIRTKILFMLAGHIVLVHKVKFRGVTKFQSCTAGILHRFNYLLQSLIKGLNTVVGDYINTMKTTLSFYC